MRREIIWSEEAYQDYSDNIEYLLAEWGVSAAQEFSDNVASILNSLPSYPYLFPATNYKRIRKGTVCKQISILYRVYSDRIEILRFWNNYQDPKRLKY